MVFATYSVSPFWSITPVTTRYLNKRSIVGVNGPISSKSLVFVSQTQEHGIGLGLFRKPFESSTLRPGFV